MSYEIFKELVLQNIKLICNDDQKVSLQTFQKNNNVTLDGLVIYDDNFNISPTIYINPFYEKYKNGSTIREICLEIYALYEESRPSINIDVTFFSDFNNSRNHIILKLINYDKNKELLEDIPHIKYLDLAICFAYYMDIEEAYGTGTIMIHNSHLKHWDITLDDLYEIALDNTRNNLPPIITPLINVINAYSEEACIPRDNNLSVDDVPLYVLHNNLDLYGSVYLSDINFLKDVSEMFGCDLIILPSSIHELIILPEKYSDFPIEFYRRMVEEINEAEVPETDILSDHIYYYSKELNKITIK